MADARTVFIVDDDEPVREALAFLLRSAGYAVEFHPSADGFLEVHHAEPRGCLLLDVRMPGRSGLELQSELNARRWRLPVIFVSSYGTIRMAIEALRAGARDFVEKPISGDLLVPAVERAFAWAERREDEEALANELCERAEALTPREREILDLVAKAEPNKIIAQRLKISYRTVELHRSHILEKLGARTTSELVRMAIALERMRPGVTSSK